MDIAIHLYICLFVCKNMKESCTFMKLQCILVILYIFHILCYIMLFGVICISSSILVKYSDYLPKFTKISFLFIYMGLIIWFV